MGRVLSLRGVADLCRTLVALGSSVVGWQALKGQIFRKTTGLSV